MIKTFCDACGAEIREEDTASRNDRGRLTATLKRGKHELKVEVMESLDGCANKGDFCRYCVLDALAKLDDRPRLA